MFNIDPSPSPQPPPQTGFNPQGKISEKRNAYCLRFPISLFLINILGYHFLHIFKKKPENKKTYNLFSKQNIIRSISWSKKFWNCKQKDVFFKGTIMNEMKLYELFIYVSKVDR